VLRERLQHRRSGGGLGKGKTKDIAALILSAEPSRPVSKSYKVLKQLGNGAFGSVFLAESKYTGEKRAIKQIPKSHVAEDLMYVNTELEAMIQLTHPNIVRFFEFFEDNKVIYLVTEVCSAGDFWELNHGIDDPTEIRLLFRDLMMAVAYCHDLGVAHRDLKFENCLIHQEPHQRRVGKVIDFGLSAIRRAGDQQSRWLNDQLGTRFFVAPEVIDVNRNYGVMCDLWSIGVMLYIVLTDEHPCSDKANTLDTDQLFRKIMFGTIRKKPLRNVGDDAADLLLKLLVKDQEKRLPACEALNHPWLVGQGLPPKSKSWATESMVSKTPSTPMDKERLERLLSFRRCTGFEKAILTLVAHQSATQDVEHLREAFMELDKAGNGTVSKDELREAIRRDCGGHKMAEADLDDLFRSIDSDCTGKIQYTEWLAATLEPSLLASEQAIKQVYDFFDIEQNGVVSAAELKEVLGDDEAASVVMEVGDTDGDGVLSEAEFKKVVQEIARKLQKAPKSPPVSQQRRAR